MWIICVFLCLVFLMLFRLLIADLWSPAGKGLTSWLLLVMFIVLFYFLMWCGTRLYRFLIFAVFLTFIVNSEHVLVNFS